MRWKRWTSLVLCAALSCCLLLTPAASAAGEEAPAPAASAGLSAGATPDTAAAAPETPPAPTETPLPPAPEPSAAPLPPATAETAETARPDPAAASFGSTLLALRSAQALAAYRQSLSDARWQTLWDAQTPARQKELTAFLSALTGFDPLAEGPAQVVTDAAALVGLAAPSAAPAAAASPAAAPRLRHNRPAPAQAAPAGAALPAASLPPAEADAPGLHLEKSVAYDAAAQSYTLTLSAWVQGITDTVAGRATDLVLVLDTSGSMGDAMERAPVYSGALDPAARYYIVQDGRLRPVWYSGAAQTWFWWDGDIHAVTPAAGPDDAANTTFYVLLSRMEVLQRAVNGFVDTLAAQNPELTDAALRNRVAIVSFADGGALVQDLTPVTAASAETLHAAVNGLTANGATNAADGMALAQKVLQASADRNRVVVFFSDGVPTAQTSFDNGVAAGAVAAARQLKSGGATVYTIGVMAGARPFADDGGFYTADAINAFLHGLSSNYPAAAWGADGSRTLGTPAALEAGKSYYLTASDSATLAQVFANISQQIPRPGTTLGPAAVVQDVLSREFTLPNGYDPAQNITLRVEPRTAVGWSGVYRSDPGLSAAVTGQNTVRVTGFDFAGNAVSAVSRLRDGSAFWGGRLLITVRGVQPNYALTSGGQNIPTNAAGSGVYPSAADAAADAAAAGSFASPRADIALRASAAPGAQYVYLLSSASLPALFAPANAAAGSGALPNGTNNAWCAAAYTLADAAGKVLGVYRVPAGAAFADGAWQDGPPALPPLAADTAYTWTVALTAAEPSAGAGKGPADGTAAARTAASSAPVRVLTPRLLLQDSTRYYGEGAADYEAENLAAPLSWRWGGLTDADPAVRQALTGAAPAVRLLYDTPAADFAQDVTVAVAAKIGEAEVTARTTFDWQPGADCPAGETAPGAARFRVHVRTGSLTVSKSVQNPDANQSFVFTVAGPNGYTRALAVQGAGSATVTGLPMGRYTVTENTAWSWRYTATGAEQTATLRRAAPAAAVTVRNTRTTANWLSWENYALNRFVTVSSATAVTAVRGSDPNAAKTDAKGEDAG